MLLSVSRSTPDLPDFVGREFGLSSGLAASLSRTSPADHLGEVFRLRPGLQMPRVHACPVVARMLHHEPIRNGAVGKLVRKPMGLRRVEALPARAKLPVTTRRLAAEPHPALVRSGNSYVSEESDAVILGLSLSHGSDCIMFTPVAKVEVK